MRPPLRRGPKGYKPMVHDSGTDYTADNRFGYGTSKATSGFSKESSNGHHKREDPPESGLTLERYAADKLLPVEFLKSINLKDATYNGGPAVRIPYPDETGTEAYYRYRVALKKEPRFLAPPKYLAPD